MLTFYEEAKAPNMLKSIILNLLSRLVVKLRYIYTVVNDKLDEATKREHLSNHFKNLFVKKDFLSTLLSELLVFKQEEEQYLLLAKPGTSH